MKALQGRVVVLADGSSALSRYLALELARVGARIVLWAQEDTGETTKAQQIVDEVRRARPRADIRVFDVDVASQQSIQQGAKNVRRELGRIDVLMNNTDFLHGATLLASSSGSVERGFALNAMATIWSTRAALPHMLSENNGAIVNFGTSADALGAPKLVDYCASKYAVMGFHEALRQELRHDKKTGIAMVLVCPTLIAQDGGVAQEESAPTTKLISSMWVRPQQAAKEIVRAMRRNKTTLVLPADFGMLSGFLAALPDNFATWVRDKLGLSKAMDHFVAPTAGRYAFYFQGRGPTATYNNGPPFALHRGKRAQLGAASPLSVLSRHPKPKANEAMTKLRNRTVLLTSCSSALGYAFAVQLAQKGANFVLWDRDLNLAQRIANELTRLYGVTTTSYQVDLRNKDQIDAAVRRVALEVLHVHVVIHASDELAATTEAGSARQQSIADKDEEEIAAVMQHHVLASLWLVKSLLPTMIEGKEGGHFVFLSSSVTFMGAGSGIVDYAASKYALLGLTRSLQHELQRLAPEIRLTTVLAPLETSKMPSSMAVGTAKKGLGRGWMKADLIAMHTIDAIKQNKRELVLPKALGFVHALCALLPQAWADSLLNQMKYSTASDALA